MDKATVESVMALAFELARIREQHGAQSGMYLSEVRALRAEVERLAAQAAPTEPKPVSLTDVLQAAAPAEIADAMAPVVQAVQAGEYPHCSGDPDCCPENEGHGCCNVADRASSGATTQAVRMRMLTEVEKLPFICPRCKVDRFKEACPGPLESCPVRFDAHAGRTIPPSGEIGGA